MCFRVTAHAGLYEAIKPTAPTSVEGSGDVAQTMAKIAAGMGLAFENNGVNKKINNIYLPGTGREQALRLAKAAGIGWTIDRGTLSIWNPGEYRHGSPTLISDKTGMRGYPSFGNYRVDVPRLNM